MIRARMLLVAAVAMFLTAGAGQAFAQADNSDQLRGSGQVGEQSDGYLGLVGDAPASVRDQVNAINIKRRAFYTDLARQRGATVQEAAVVIACKLFETKVQPGQFYRLPDGAWRKREGAIALPSYCG